MDTKIPQIPRSLSIPLTAQQTVVNINHPRFPKYDVYIGWKKKVGHRKYAQSKWCFGQKDITLDEYEKFIRKTPELMNALGELDGKILGCWCKPGKCHGDVLARLVREKKWDDQKLTPAERKEAEEKLHQQEEALLTKKLAEQKREEKLREQSPPTIWVGPALNPNNGIPHGYTLRLEQREYEYKKTKTPYSTNSTNDTPKKTESEIFPLFEDIRTINDIKECSYCLTHETFRDHLTFLNRGIDEKTGIFCRNSTKRFQWGLTREGQVYLYNPDNPEQITGRIVANSLPEFLSRMRGEFLDWERKGEKI